MKVKEYLKEYQRLNIEINSMVGESCRLRRLAENIGVSRYDGNGAGGKHAKAGAAHFESAVDKITEVETGINTKIDELIEKREKIAAAIETVDDTTLRSLLKYRYLDGYTFERVAVEMNYSWRWVLDLHGQALKEIAKTINTSW